MKKLDIKLAIICVLGCFLLLLVFRGPRIQEVEKIVEVEKEVIVNDTIEIEKKVPYKVEVLKEVPIEVIKEIEKVVTVHDTIIEQQYIKVPVEKIKEVDRIVEVPRPKTQEWYLGLGYDFGRNPFFSGAGTQLLFKNKNDVMFGGEIGFRNNITNFETLEGRIKPYIGLNVYIKLKSKE